MDTTELIFKTLVTSSDPLKAGEIAAKSGIDKNEVDKVLKKLMKESNLPSTLLL